MSAEKNVQVRITADVSKLIAALESARITIVRLRERRFGLAPDDISRQFPSCTYDHEVTFLGTEGGLDRPCPGCGAAL